MDPQPSELIKQKKASAASASSETGYAHSKKIQTVMESLTERMRQNEWSSDEALPSQRCFSREYGVSQGAISIAMRNLQKEGIIRMVPGRGAFVAGHSEAEGGRIYPTVGLRGEYTKAGAGLPLEKNSYRAHVMEAIWGAAHTDDRPLLLLSGGANLTKQYCLSRGVQGVVFLGGLRFQEAMDLRLQGFPVIISNYPRRPAPINYVDHDHAASLREIVRRFTEAGHQRIAAIFPATSTPGSFQSLKPEFITALYQAGLYYNVDDYWVYLEDQPNHSDGPYAHAPQKLDALLRIPEPPTALFCFCASFYWRYIEQYLRERNVSIPTDLSVAFATMNLHDSYQKVSGFTFRYDLLARELLHGIHETIRNPFYSVQKLLPLEFEDHGSIAPPKA